jgi:hypothetical protein
MGFKARAELVQYITSLLPAGRPRRQNPLYEPAPRLAVCTCADPPPDHRVLQRALRSIVRRLRSREPDEVPTPFVRPEDPRARPHRGRVRSDRPVLQRAAKLRGLNRAEALGLSAKLPGGVERGKNAKARRPAELAAAVAAGGDDNRPYSSPHLWAAFVLAGDPDWSTSSNRSTSRRDSSGDRID